MRLPDFVFCPDIGENCAGLFVYEKPFLAATDGFDVVAEVEVVVRPVLAFDDEVRLGERVKIVKVVIEFHEAVTFVYFRLFVAFSGVS